MIFNISINRIQRKDSIEEIFTWNPNSRFIFDYNRNLLWLMRLFIAKKSIHSKIDGKLVDIIYNDRSIIYIYNGSVHEHIQRVESFNIKYNPVLGNKSCRNCGSLKRLNGKVICVLRGSKGAKTIHMKGCTDWNEPLYWRE